MKQFTGQVLSDKMTNTLIVEVSRQWRHPLYGKTVTKKRKYACHYTKDDIAVGDTVVFEECTPISKTKRFRVVKKIG